jgi:L-sorbose 1-phosphate reductase
MKPSTDIPATQYAVQLTGPGTLVLNRTKTIPRPAGYQMLAKVEATGLCFSDLKLLKQFDTHPRKTEVISGLPAEALQDNPSYVPGSKPTVPGHETVVKIVAVGEKVKEHRIGERCLVQTDYRNARTKGGSNGAFGYNFEGGLQEYVIIDERISRDPQTGERFLIPVKAERSSAAICLAEPWACVEDSYLNEERTTIKAGGHLLIAGNPGNAWPKISKAFSPKAAPARITFLGSADLLPGKSGFNVPVTCVAAASDVPDASVDDIIYFGADRAVTEALGPKLGTNGIINLVTGPNRFGAPATIGIGRIHYGMTRWIGTRTDDPADSYKMIPRTGEIRSGDSCLVVGAGGPMGQMHVIRFLCAGIKGIRVTATDFDEPRLQSLARLANPLAAKNGIPLCIANPQKQPAPGPFTYIAIMVPVPQLVVKALADCAPDSIMNIFAGIPAPTMAAVDLDAMIDKKCFMFGTSGSTLTDMKAVLSKVEAGTLDTNVSVDAVSGIAGAIDGIAAVENRTLAGKIIVYPQLHDLGLTPIAQLAGKFPSVAAKLKNGVWTAEAEKELIATAGK